MQDALAPSAMQSGCVYVCVCMEDLHGHPVVETVECRREHSALLSMLSDAHGFQRSP